ncbi:cytidine deaminase [Marinomonas pollencensis]|uniref:Cytidine deaminase n=1 Tax=Marinomonas pollencensis TaxID=491954 RepID=A0A3E0DM52_9GAMM|nr:cytidine deaminase [Marinomonas pollencensis]REG82598.1 cytidine deaminase [Marinomonas pollencensis]
MAADGQAFELAKAAMSKAYVPYSQFKVGVAIETSSGRYYSGCNVENASYPEGTCAEAGAIAAMVLDGESQIKNIYVMGNGAELVTPCGGCRQRIREFASEQTRIHVCSSSQVRRTFTMEELLPCSFGPENLAK